VPLPGLWREENRGSKKGNSYTLELIFPDTEENRLNMGRFLMGGDFHAVPRQAMLQCFDPYAHAGQITMQLVHKHFIIQRYVQGRELLEARA